MPPHPVPLPFGRGEGESPAVPGRDWLAPPRQLYEDEDEKEEEDDRDEDEEELLPDDWSLIGPRRCRIRNGGFT